MKITGSTVYSVYCGVNSASEITTLQSTFVEKHMDQNFKIIRSQAYVCMLNGTDGIFTFKPIELLRHFYIRHAWSKYKLIMLSNLRPLKSCVVVSSTTWAITSHLNLRLICLLTKYIPFSPSCIQQFNPLKSEFTIVNFIHYKSRIAVAILDL